MVNCSGARAVLVRTRAPIAFCILALGGFLLLREDFAGSQHVNVRSKTTVDIAASFGHLPLAFEPNEGQSDRRVKFLARGIGYGLYLTPTDAVLALAADHGNRTQSSYIKMRLAGSNPKAEIAGLNQLPGHSNYLIGNVPSRWHRNIPQFSRVRYSTVYPGIDLDFYGNQGRLEYDFEVNPGADFRHIELDLNGAQKLKISANGDLVVELNGRELRFKAPRIYQEAASRNQTVAGKFVLHGKDRVAFDVGAYDHSRTLVIDPVLSFSTYLGGAGNESCTKIIQVIHPAVQFVPNCPAVAVDSAERVYIAGATDNTSGFPIAASGAPAAIPPGGAADVFVARVNSTGSQVDFITFLGGSGIDYPTGVGVDSGFNIYVAGTTLSSDFPTTQMTAFQRSANGTHVFVSKLDPTGSANLYSTYLAGSGTDMASSLAVDSQGREYVFGTTTSPNFPVTPGALQATALAANQFFFTKLDPGLSGSNSVPFSTFIGGSSPASGVVTGGAIAVDSNFNVYLAGGTNFTDMPLLNAFQGIEQGVSNVWVAKLNAPANNTQQYTPSFETYFGGSGDDIAYGVSTDGTNTYVTGSTTSANITIPSGTTAFQPTIGGGMDAFVAKFGAPTAATTGTAQGTVPLSYFTYLGGSGNDAGLAIVADSTTPTSTSGGNVRVTGFTDSSDFPVKNNPLQGTSGGGRDAFVARILTTSTSSTTDSSAVTYLGGGGTDIGTSITEDTALNTYVVGETSSGNFPTAAPPPLTPLQTTLAGPSDAFISKLGPNVAGLLSFACNPLVPVSGPGCPSPAPANPTVSPSPVGVGNTVTFTYLIYNQGDPVTGAIFTDTAGTGSTISGQPSTSVGTCSGGTGTTTQQVVCELGTIPTSTTTTTTSGSTTTSTTASAAKVTVTVTATVPASTGAIPPKPPDIGNSAILSLTGTPFTQTASGSASVNDFGVSAVAVNPPGGVVTAGVTAPYEVTVTPTGPFPEAVSLSCGSPLPAGATCSFSNSSIANLNSGPRSVTLDIATTVRVTTPASLFRHNGPVYALWLPLSGLALIGSGVSQKRRLLLAMIFAVVLSWIVLESACSSSSRAPSGTTGTPAGTYSITVNATSGSTTRSTAVQLAVK